MIWTSTHDENGERRDLVERLVCPFCGYSFTREEHPAAAYCGPHKLPDGSYWPAHPMIRFAPLAEEG